MDDDDDPFLFLIDCDLKICFAFGSIDRIKPIFFFIFATYQFEEVKKILKANDLIDNEGKKFLFIVVNLKYVTSR